MRTKLIETKKELENAFTFGHTRNFQNSESSNKRLPPNYYKQYTQRVEDKHYFDKSIKENYNFRKTQPQSNHKKTIDLKTNINLQGEFQKKIDNNDQKFIYGKAIKSETIEESIDTIISPLQQEVEMMNLQENDKYFQKSTYSNLYNPSIQDIKKKYGYTQIIPQTFHKSRWPKDNYQEVRQKNQKTKLITLTPKKACDQYRNVYERIYGYNNKLSNNLLSQQNPQRFPLTHKLDYSPNNTYKRSTILDVKDYNCGAENYEHFQKMKDVRDRSKAFKRTSIENMPPERIIQKHKRSNTHLNSKLEQPNKNWMLRSINDLDSQINEKIFRMIPEGKNNRSVHRRY